MSNTFTPVGPPGMVKAGPADPIRGVATGQNATWQEAGNLAQATSKNPASYASGPQLSTVASINKTVDDTSPAGPVVSQDQIYAWVAELVYGPNREHALLELGKKREQCENLALILWYSQGVVTVLLQEIVSVYSLLSPPQLTMAASNKLCNALALLQCIASHDQTRTAFLKAHLPLFLYPFLNTTSKARAFEFLRLTSLGVVGALVKDDSTDVVNFLLSTEIIPLCLRIIETGTELSKTVAIFIVQKILVDDIGLNYVCQTYERFYAVSAVLANVVQQLLSAQPTSSRLLKHVVHCYLRLSDDPRARESLRQILPEPLRDATFSLAIRGDTATKRALSQLLVNLSSPSTE